MSEGPFQRPTWAWTEANNDATPTGKSHNPPGSFETGESSANATRRETKTKEPREAQNGNPEPKPQRSYLPRTCRICLEVVHPKFEPAPEGLASMLHPNSRSSYISEDPVSGRLIRPCKCRGSQQYVHEGCLQSWRYSDACVGKKNFWECPTCRFRYRLERLTFSRWISNPGTEILLTIIIMLIATFFFGFIADPIIDLYLDPVNTITSMPLGRRSPSHPFEAAEASWTEHFIKGIASIGLLGFLKVLFALPWWHVRQGGALGGVGRGRVLGRNRLENISWSVVIAGIVTFLYLVWKWLHAWSRRTLEKAGERVTDVQGDDDDGGGAE